MTTGTPAAVRVVPQPELDDEEHPVSTVAVATTVAAVAAAHSRAKVRVTR
jgi:hypothetical protein